MTTDEQIAAVQNLIDTSADLLIKLEACRAELAAATAREAAKDNALRYVLRCIQSHQVYDKDVRSVVERALAAAVPSVEAHD